MTNWQHSDEITWRFYDTQIWPPFSPYFSVGFRPRGFAICIPSPGLEFCTRTLRLRAATRKASVVAVYMKKHTPFGTHATSEAIMYFAN